MTFFYFTILLFVAQVCWSGSCPANYHRCGRLDPVPCIPAEWMCDQNEDCQDGSDEKNCPRLTCAIGQVKCRHSSVCVARNKICDGIIDCPDQTDERHCSVVWTKDQDKPQSRMCSRSTQFNCGNEAQLECVALTKVCDGHSDCSTSFDERLPCERNPCNDTGTLRAGCSHTCINKYSSFVCDCPAGMVLNIDQRTCARNDSCSSNIRLCEQKCVNLPKGDYQCECYTGYEPSGSNGQCVATKTESKVHLFYLSSDRIIDLPLYDNSTSSYTLLKFSGDVLAFDIAFSKTNLTVYSSLVAKTHSLRLAQLPLWLSDPLIGRSHTKQSQLPLPNIAGDVIADPGEVYSVAVDDSWGLLFWTDTSSGSVSVMSTHKTNDAITIVNRDCIYPISIRVNTVLQRLYWLDLGNRTGSSQSAAADRRGVGPRIISSAYDGSQRSVLVTSQWLRKPSSVILDASLNRIYWTNHDPGSISYLDLEDPGNKPQTLLEHEELQPFDITILEDKIYWSDWRQNRIYSANKLSGSVITAVVSIYKPTRLVVFSGSQRQMPLMSASDTCHTANCPHSCLPGPNNVKCFGPMDNNKLHIIVKPASSSSLHKKNWKIWLLMVLPGAALLATLLLIVRRRNANSGSLNRSPRHSRNIFERLLPSRSNRSQVSGPVTISYDNVNFYETTDQMSQEGVLEGEYEQKPQDQEFVEEDVDVLIKDTVPIVIV